MPPSFSTPISSSILLPTYPRIIVPYWADAEVACFTYSFALTVLSPTIIILRRPIFLLRQEVTTVLIRWRLKVRNAVERMNANKVQ